MDKKLIIEILKKISEKIDQEADYLTDLDRQIGDGDHGINLKRGFQAINESLDKNKDKSIPEILNACAMSLMTKVGGSSGPLLATAFMRMAKEKDFASMINAANEGVKQRGKAVVGEKTMIDVLEPFAHTYKKEFDITQNHCQAIHQAIKIAKDKLAYTKTIKATKGRASYLGDRSIGVVDPGAQSTFFMLEVVEQETCKGKND